MSAQSTVLVVEDEVHIAHVLTFMLERQGYLVTHVADGRAAVQQVASTPAPFWWGSHRELLDGLAACADTLTVMDYRTDPGQVHDFAVPFLDWAEARGKGVRIALEAGAIDPEVQRRYARIGSGAGEAGDLQALDIQGRTVLALLRAPVAAPDARLYRLQSTRDIDGSATTFHRDKAALLRLLPQMEADFGAWDGFRGMAVHELR
jgi:CheY-like chemotaxis protein